MALNWDRYRNELGILNLEEAVKDLLGLEYHKMPAEDTAYLKSILAEINELTPIKSEEDAAIALVTARQLLLLTQIMSNIMWDIAEWKKKTLDLDVTIHQLIKRLDTRPKIITTNKMPGGKNGQS